VERSIPVQRNVNVHRVYVLVLFKMQAFCIIKNCCSPNFQKTVRVNLCGFLSFKTTRWSSRTPTTLHRSSRQEKAPPLTVSLARGAWGLSEAHMSALIRRQNLSELEGARPFVFRAYINCRQSNFLSTMHGSLRKNASATKIDCAFICVKARQCSQVDSCSFTSLPDFPASCEPLADIASSLRNTSPLAASNQSVLLSGVTVNALAFTFRIAYQKAGCSIFVPVLQERKLG